MLDTMAAPAALGSNTAERPGEGPFQDTARPDELDDTSLAADADESLLATMPGDSEASTERSSASREGHRRGDRLGRYTLKERLGKGGMGEVWSAHDAELDRKVAIKFILPTIWGVLGESAKALFRREAQSMARLDHPNVVAIYDISDSGEYVTLQYVDGGSLTKWLQDDERKSTDILARFIEAGQGLDAAHDAGLVHCDFKPDNVLIKSDGSACVADFGLACLATGPGTGTGGGSNAPAGTPLYMAPEQYEFGDVDSRCDQFGFCVSLWEALTGEHPFPTGDARTLKAAVLAGEIRTSPSSRSIPKRIRRALLRGMQTDPQARFPSMKALVAELRPRRTRQKLALGAALLAVGAAASVLAAGDERERCSLVASPVQDLWNDKARETFLSTLLASAQPGAAAIAPRVSAILDDVFDQQITLRRQFCRVTKITESQSEALYDRQMICLDTQLEAAKALVERLGSDASRVAVERSVDAALDLPAASECQNSERLLTGQDVPSSQEDRERFTRGEEYLAKANVLDNLGQPEEALALLDQAEGFIDASMPQLLARVVCSRASIQGFRGQHEQALKGRERCAKLAAKAKDQVTMVSAWTAMMGLEGFYQGKFQAALDRSEMIETAIEGAGNPPKLVANFAHIRGMVLERAGQADKALEDYETALKISSETLGDLRKTATIKTSIASLLYSQQRYDEANKILEEALEVRRNAYGPFHLRVLTSEVNVATMMTSMDKPKEGIQRLRQTLDTIDEHLGPSHPLASTALLNLCETLLNTAAANDAIEPCERGLQIRRAINGEEHADTATAYEIVAKALHAQGKFDEALKLSLRALGIRRKILPELHPELAFPLYSIARTYQQQDKAEAALPLLEEVVEIRKAQQPRNPARLSTALVGLAIVATDLGDFERACPAYQSAFDLSVEVGGPSSPSLSYVLVGLAECAAQRDDWALAATHADRALQLHMAQSMRNPVATAGLELTVADLYWKHSPLRSRARALIGSAEASLNKLGPEGEHLRRELASWRRKHNLK